MIVPESVLSYATKPDVQTAVDLMLTGKEPKIPGNLRWEEMAAFYRACLAARQVQVELALFLEELWRAVWIDFPATWKPRAPSDPARPDMSVAVSNVWSEGCFSRGFERSGCILEFAVCLEDETLKLGMALWDEEGDNLLDLDPPKTWSKEGFDYYWTQEIIEPLSPNIALEPFRSFMNESTATIDRLIESHGR